MCLSGYLYVEVMEFRSIGDGRQVWWRIILRASRKLTVDEKGGSTNLRTFCSLLCLVVPVVDHAFPQVDVSPFPLAALG